MHELVGATRSGGTIFVAGMLFFGVIWALFLLPFLFHVGRAVLARDAWLPFARKPDGGYTFMAQNRWFASFRAPRTEERRPFGLAVRYAVWVAVVVVLGYLPLQSLGFYLGR